TYEGSRQKVLVSAEDSMPPSDAQSRYDAYAEFKFQGLPVVPDDAVQDGARFLDGFSYPYKGTRGVLVYILGAPSDPWFRNDPRLEALDKRLGEARMLAVIASFTPGSQGDQDRYKTTANHQNLRFLEFGATEESESYFKTAFAEIALAI